MNAKLGAVTKSVDTSQSALVIAAIMISVIGPSVFIVQPGFVQGLVEELSVTESQAGYIAAIEMWGIAATTLALVFLTNKLNWQKLLYISSLLMIIGNIASIFFLDEIWAFSAARAVVGVGAGCMISLGFSILGLTKDPDRNYGYMVMWVLLYGAVVLVSMPQMLRIFGLEGLLWFFAAFSALALFFIKNLPRSGQDLSNLEADASSDYSIAVLLGVGGVLVFFTAIGAIWAYLFLIGLANGSNEQSVANTLMFSQFLGALGAYTAAVIGAKFGKSKPIVAGILGCVIPILLIFILNIPLIYIAAICLFNFGYNMTHPYLYAALIAIDPSASIVKYAVGAQMLGIAIGPSIAATLVLPHDFSSVIILAALLFCVSLAMMTSALYAHNNKSAAA